MKNNLSFSLTFSALVAFLVFGGITSAQAQEEPTFSVSGTVDSYYRSSEYAPGTSFANLNGFSLGMANIVLSYEGEKSGFVADLVYGPRGADAVFGSSGSSSIVNQLYVYYNVSDSFTLTLGNFNTFLGYEVISPAANFNYTVSYLFNAGPFSHTGIKLDYAASEDLSYMLAVTNSHAISSADGNVGGEMQFGAQVGYKGQYLNFIYGAYSETSATDVLFLDYTGGFDLSESLYLGINAAYSYSDDEEAGYQGAALYIENTFSETFALGLRPEFFSYTSADDSEDVLALTLAASTQLDDNLKLITELRYDSSDDYIIEGIAAEKNATALTIAAVYSF